MIRVALLPVLYPDNKMSYNHPSNATLFSKLLPRDTHLEHCMDRIRQLALCYGDLTPGPFYTTEDFGDYVGAVGVHTCRKMEPIREWLAERNERYPLTKPVHSHSS